MRFPASLRCLSICCERNFVLVNSYRKAYCIIHKNHFCKYNCKDTFIWKFSPIRNKAAAGILSNSKCLRAIEINSKDSFVPLTLHHAVTFQNIGIVSIKSSNGEVENTLLGQSGKFEAKKCPERKFSTGSTATKNTNAIDLMSETMAGEGSISDITAEGTEVNNAEKKAAPPGNNNNYALNKKSVRWMFDTSSWEPTPEAWILALSSVQHEEVSRINRFVFRKDARRTLVGRLLARMFVVHAASIPWHAVRLGRTAKGKPVLEEGCANVEVEFSLSHSGRWVVLAGEARQRGSGVGLVGADVVEEAHRNPQELIRTLRRQLSPAERAVVEGAGADGAATFFRLWALKESYLKATGEGIGGGTELKELSFSLSAVAPEQPGNVVVGTTLSVRGRPLPAGWRFEESRLDSSHVAAVALFSPESEKSVAPRPFREVTWEDVVTAIEPVTHLQPSDGLNYFSKPESPSHIQPAVKK